MKKKNWLESRYKIVPLVINTKRIPYHSDKPIGLSVSALFEESEALRAKYSKGLHDTLEYTRLLRLATN